MQEPLLRAIPSLVQLQARTRYEATVKDGVRCSPHPRHRALLRLRQGPRVSHPNLFILPRPLLINSSALTLVGQRGDELILFSVFPRALMSLHHRAGPAGPADAGTCAAAPQNALLPRRLPRRL